jgi:SAM-dependent methyltransferase
MDVGCGSGRWAALVAPRVGRLHCVDASDEALAVARVQLSSQANCTFHVASVEALPLPDSSLDFGYSLGVLHHVPDTAAGLAACVRKLKLGAPFLLYLYYALENRSPAYRALWRASDVLRRSICRLPQSARFRVTDALAASVYWPLARGAGLAEKVGLGRLGIDPAALPLATYRTMSFYSMRTDAHDRFGTALEQRFSRAEIHAMMQSAGLEQIRFREEMPYWVAVGVRRARQ